MTDYSRSNILLPHFEADSHYTFPILSGIYKNGRALAKVWSNAKESKTAHLLRVAPRFAQARMLESYTNS